jgi:hypothetical protein
MNSLNNYKHSTIGCLFRNKQECKAFHGYLKIGVNVKIIKMFLIDVRVHKALIIIDIL